MQSATLLRAAGRLAVAHIETSPRTRRNAPLPASRRRKRGKSRNCAFGLNLHLSLSLTLWKTPASGWEISITSATTDRPVPSRCIHGKSTRSKGAVALAYRRAREIRMVYVGLWRGTYDNKRQKSCGLKGTTVCSYLAWPRGKIVW